MMQTERERSIILRSSPIRSGFLPKPRIVGGVLTGTREEVLLIHGYNTTQLSARQNYLILMKKLRDLTSVSARPLRIWQVFWPGSELSHSWNPRYFRRQIPNAICSGAKIGKLFGQILRRHGRKPNFILVGHSLGARVLLETLRMFSYHRKDQSHRSAKFIVMGGAVPYKYLLPGGRLRRAIKQAQERVCFCSSRDRTLRFPFRIVNLGNSRDFSEAVGLNGKPSDCWTQDVVDMKIEHTEYWNSKEVAYRIAKNAGTKPDEILRSRQIVSTHITHRSISEYFVGNRTGSSLFGTRF